MRRTKLLLRNARLVDGTGREEIAGASILIVEGEIANICSGKIGQSAVDDEAEVIDLEGLTVLPGFINAHTHAGFVHIDGEPYRQFHEG